jgi:hypothetical protein
MGGIFTFKRSFIGGERMNVNIRADSVEIEGYVNAIERDSKTLWSRTGPFIEKICKGAFKRALERNKDVQILLNHDWNRNLGSTGKGNLELTEDNIGLHARAVITDSDVIKDARNGDLVGWSFAFDDVKPDGVIERIIDGIKHRAVKDLNLYEVSILNRQKTPAYDGTLIMARAEDSDKMIYRAEPFYDDSVVVSEKEEEAKEETRDAPEQQEAEKIDYSKYNEIIKEMKED